MRRGKVSPSRLDYLVRRYADAAAAFSSAQSAVGTYDDLVRAWSRRKEAELALKRAGYTVDGAYARLSELAKEGAS